jgi:NADPH:quinone reductase-like Zn-dependent oxidoreductase
VKAAVLHELGILPRYEEFPDPVPIEGEILVTVRAAPLTNLSKSRALGSHYDSYKQLPAVCGVDGVAVTDEGERLYCGGCRPPYGTMAERTVVSRAWCLPIPDGIDDVTAAAVPNAALSSWLALEYRAKLQPGEKVLVMGATGNAGKGAIQVAKHLGAKRVVAAGRNEQALSGLPALGADTVISLSQSDQALAEAFTREAPFDVIIDYLWGHPAEVLLGALTGHDLRAEPSPIRYVEIGAMAGPTASIPSEALRSVGLELSGGGGGSVSHQAIVDSFPKIWALAASGKLRVDIERVPLADVESAWQRQGTAGRRLVFIP